MAVDPVRLSHHTPHVRPRPYRCWVPSTVCADELTGCVRCWLAWDVVERRAWEGGGGAVIVDLAWNIPHVPDPVPSPTPVLRVPTV